MLARRNLSALLLASLATLPCHGREPDEPEAQLPVDPVAEQRLLELAGPESRIRRTDHFLIAYNTSDTTVAGLVSRLEATQRGVYRFCRINDLPAGRLTHRLEVLFFETYEQYGEAARAIGFNYQGSSGFYSHQSNIATFFNVLNSPSLKEINRLIEQANKAIEALRRRKPVDRKALRAKVKERSRLANVRDRAVERINRSTVQHETAHQLFFNCGVHVRGAQNPAWLVEGLACLFETPPTSSGSGAGAINQARLADFRACLGGKDPRDKLSAEDLQVALSAGKFVPLRTLVGDPSLFTSRNNRNLVHYYSQAWSLVCYLQRAKRDQLAEYLRLLGQRELGAEITSEREVADFESVFGPPDERFERNWADYILTKLRFKPSELN